MSLADGFPTALVRELMRARERVDIAMYSMVVFRSRPEAPAADATAAARERHARDMAEYRENLERGEVHVADALAELVERGVRVRVIYDHARENERKVAETAGLLALGARVYTHGRTVHHKFAVIDGHTVVTGSGNWSAGAFHRYDEDWIIFRDRPPLARQFQAELETILAGCEEVRP